MPKGSNAAKNLAELFELQAGRSPVDDVFQLVDWSKIEAWPEQPRDHITPDQVRQKRESISEGFQAGTGLSRTGIDMALIARPHPDPEKRAEGFLMLIDGELRWRGCTPDNKTPLPKRLPVNVRNVSEEEAWEIAGVSGLLHESYSPVQQMRIVQRYIQGQNKQKRKMSVREAGERFGKSKSWVSDLLVIADPDENAPQAAKELIFELQQMVSARADSLRHARELQKVADPEKRRDLIQQVIEGLSLEALKEIIDPNQKEQAASQVSAHADTSSTSGSSKNGVTTPGAAPAQQGSGFASGGSSDFKGTTSRSHVSGLANPPSKKPHLVRDNLRPMVSFAAEGLRIVKETKISPTMRKEAEQEITRARGILDQMENELGL